MMPPTAPTGRDRIAKGSAHRYTHVTYSLKNSWSFLLLACKAYGAQPRVAETSAAMCRLPWVKDGKVDSRLKGDRRLHQRGNSISLSARCPESWQQSQKPCHGHALLRMTLRTCKDFSQRTYSFLNLPSSLVIIFEFRDNIASFYANRIVPKFCPLFKEPNNVRVPSY